MTERTCSIEGCGKRVKARGWCATHWARWRKYGTTALPSRCLPFGDRFWPKVDKNGPIPDYAPHLGPCWIWTAAMDRKGYGQITVTKDGRKRHAGAHRASYEFLVGPIPDGLQLDHLCRVTACVNPTHLEPVTNRENMLRGFTIAARNAAVTHCPHGHEYTSDNIYWMKNGGRKCRACALKDMSDRKRRKRVERLAAMNAVDEE